MARTLLLCYVTSRKCPHPIQGVQLLLLTLFTFFLIPLPLYYCTYLSPLPLFLFQTEHVRIIYQCTWPGCHATMDVCSDIEKHIRRKHLQ